MSDSTETRNEEKEPLKNDVDETGKVEEENNGIWDWIKELLSSPDESPSQKFTLKNNEEEISFYGKKEDFEKFETELKNNGYTSQKGQENEYDIKPPKDKNFKDIKEIAQNFPELGIYDKNIIIYPPKIVVTDKILVKDKNGEEISGGLKKLFENITQPSNDEFLKMVKDTNERVICCLRKLGKNVDDLGASIPKNTPSVTVKETTTFSNIAYDKKSNSFSIPKDCFEKLKDDEKTKLTEKLCKEFGGMVQGGINPLTAKLVVKDPNEKDSPEVQKAKEDMIKKGKEIIAGRNKANNPRDIPSIISSALNNFK